MSTLKVALQNVSLARTSMAHRYEELVKNNNTLTDLREAIRECPELRDCLRDSMSSLMTVCRFQRMVVKDHPIRLGVPASEQSILDQFQHAMFIEPDLK